MHIKLKKTILLKKENINIQKNNRTATENVMKAGYLMDIVTP